MLSTRRMLIGLAMLVFVAAFFAPIASALSLCHMPCCHHGASAPPSCPSKCTISKAPAEVPAVASVSAQQAAPVVSVELAPVVHVVAVFVDAPISPHRPLHLVHAVFRI
jgi:hypothetical protein